MKKVLLVAAFVFAVNMPVHAASFDLVAPVRWTTRAIWGVVKMIQKVPADTLDAMFAGTCGLLRCDPVTPLWD